jgi:threonyl-tRNA synthetase
MFWLFRFENFTAQISLRQENREKELHWSDENWEKAGFIINAEDKGLSTYEYGEAAFYGPELD